MIRIKVRDKCPLMAAITCINCDAAVTHQLAVCDVYVADQQSTLLVVFDTLQTSDLRAAV